MLAKILDLQARSTASGAGKIATVDPRGPPKIARAAEEAGGAASGNTAVTEAGTTGGGDAGGEDVSDKRNREVQGEGVLGLGGRHS